MALVFKITPTIQQYDWGKIGADSKVAQLASASKIPGFVLESKPYAELWMGTHTSSPSTVNISGLVVPLSNHLASNPALCGDALTHKFPEISKGNLPFLLKVLSIEKALSIQRHPDKKTAEILHQKYPKIYKDDNHKPEMALALTPFQALCGFLPLPSIANNLKATPELASLIPKDTLDAFFKHASSNSDDAAAKKALKDVFSALMNAEESTFGPPLVKLVERYRSQDSENFTPQRDLVLRLDSQFPGDIGIFCVFMLNHVVLKQGEAIFLGAGEPHAYVEGDIIECMANSDNVIRAGLTPKLRDVQNLVAGLTYVPAEGSHHGVKPSSFSGSCSLLYDPPVPEFAVVQVDLSPGATEKHRAVKGPSLMIVTQGGGKVAWGDEDTLQVNIGDVFFVACDIEVQFSTEEGLVMYRALVEDNEGPAQL